METRASRIGTLDEAVAEPELMATSATALSSSALAGALPETVIRFSEPFFSQRPDARIPLVGGGFIAFDFPFSAVASIDGSARLVAGPYVIPNSQAAMGLSLGWSGSYTPRVEFNLGWLPSDPTESVLVVLTVFGSSGVLRSETRQAFAPTGLVTFDLSTSPEATGYSISIRQPQQINLTNTADVLWVDDITFPGQIFAPLPAFNLTTRQDATIAFGDARSADRANATLSGSVFGPVDFDVAAFATQGAASITFSLRRADFPDFFEQKTISVSNGGLYYVQMSTVPASNTYGIPYTIEIVDVTYTGTSSERLVSEFAEKIAAGFFWATGEFISWVANLVRTTGTDAAGLSAAFSGIAKKLGAAEVIFDFATALDTVRNTPLPDRDRAAFVEFGAAFINLAFEFSPIGRVSKIGGLVAETLGLLSGPVLVESWVKDQLGAIWDLTVASGAAAPAVSEGSSAQALVLGPPVLDVTWYLQTYADARQAIASGQEASALDHWYSRGRQLGYAINAEGERPAATPKTIARADAAMDARPGIFDLGVGQLHGDGQNGQEAAFLAALTAQTGAAIMPSAVLYALSNRRAADAVHHASFVIAAGDDRSALPGWSTGESLQQGAAFLGVSQPVTFFQLDANVDGVSAANTFLSRPDFVAAIQRSGGAAIGIAEYGGFWVVIVGAPGAFGGAPAPSLNETLYRTGTEGNDLLVAGSWAASMSGRGGADVLIGGTFSDRLAGGAGNDNLNGGAGVDTAVYSIVFGSGVAFARNVANAWTVIAGSDGVDTLTGIEFLQFTNRSLALRPAEGSIDGNGTSDILLRSSSGAVALWTMSGATTTSRQIVALSDPNFTSIGQGDFDGDGKFDVLFRNTGGILAQWKMNGASVSSVGAYVTDPNWQIVGIGDFNGDFKDDILYRNSGGLLAQWQMNGLSASAVGVFAASDPTWSVAQVADFNGDGKDDLLWRNSGGLVALWQMDSFAVTWAGVIALSDPAWQIVGTGDFNGDLREDILWRSPGGVMAQWQMDGGAVTTVGTFALSDPNWSVSDIGDYNGDGRDDILWQGPDGSFALWTLDGFAVTSSGLIGNPGAGWTDIV